MPLVGNLMGGTGGTGATGGTGDLGVTGVTGTSTTGVTGVTGVEGTKWSSGDGVPSDANGRPGDFYLNNLTGDVYLKAGVPPDDTWF